MIVTHRDLQAMRYCNKGAREFFRRHGLDWTRFIAEGLPAEDFVKTGDHMAIQLVEFAKERQHGR